MKIIVKARGLGKSNGAGALANGTGAYLVVNSKQEATRPGPRCNRFPVTFDELLRNRTQGLLVRNIVIDNADDLIQGVVGGRTIEGITMTGPKK